jgi:hypothetical protein
MSNGIICSVWNIKGETEKKACGTQVSQSIEYIFNKEKTKGTFDLDPFNQLSRECKYIENDLKTYERAFVSGHNIMSYEPREAALEMMEVKQTFGKLDGRSALHMVISLPEEESIIENASKLLQLADSVVKELFPDNQAVYAVHTNTDNLHVHIILNSVDLKGRKIHQPKGFIKNVLDPCVNKYANVFGFAPNEKWKNSESDTLSFPQIKMLLRTQIDLAIEAADSFESFSEILKENDITVRTGKYISLKLPGMAKAVRTHNLGSNYTRDAIVERIATKKEKMVLQQKRLDNVLTRPDDVFTPTIFKMPKYKEMSESQKKEVLHQLRLGKNPWRENKKMNWQLNLIADEINSEERIRSYIGFYSKDGTIENALENMISAKKNAANEKKLIKFSRTKYKPILDIYSEMKSLEKRAFLYEHKRYTEYRAEFEQYRLLTRRLKNTYNKEVFEVATFLQECDERFEYADAQINEISAEYRELKKYALQRGISVVSDKENNFMDLFGYYSDKESTKSGIAEVDSFYIASCHSDVVIRVVKSPAMDSYGHVIESYSLTVMDKYGNTVHELTNENGDKKFKEGLDKLQKQYNLMDCKKFNNLKKASEYCNTSDVKEGSKSNDTKVRFEEMDSSIEKKYTFAQAINHVTEDKPFSVVVSKVNPSYIALSSAENDMLKIIVFNNKRITEEVFYIPLVKEKNTDGFKTLSKIMDKYNFHDEVKEFDSVDEAREYSDQQDKEKKKNIRV